MIYRDNVCGSLNIGCKGGQTINPGGGAWVSSGYIRNRGEFTFESLPWDLGYPDNLTNNPPPTPLYVRCAVSQYDPTKRVLWVNGLQQPRLVLTRGRKYQFNVMTCASGGGFFFTSQAPAGRADGNVGNLTHIEPSDYFVSTIVINDKFPTNFYYQMTKIPGNGRPSRGQRSPATAKIRVLRGFRPP